MVIFHGYVSLPEGIGKAKLKKTNATATAVDSIPQCGEPL